MDRREALANGAVLPFPGMPCSIERLVGRGSNAIVYEGSYPDAVNSDQRHRVLIKELFPYDAHGHIWRGADHGICRDEQGQAVWEMHKRSFERGNTVHLRLLQERPDWVGGNLNTYSLNGTYYTILEYSGGRSLDGELREQPAKDLRKTAARIDQLLYALEIFHQRGYLHLDISLDNVLLVGQGEQERVVLIDYNSVHTREELLREEDIYFSGKEGFTAPEVRVGMTQAIAPCTDIFSVTAVFFACLTGKPPTLMQLGHRHPPDALDSPLLRDVPSTVKAQIRKMMHRGLCTLPEKRYQTCAEMRRDLRELQDRLRGIGVTHAALWEVGRRGVQRLVQRNPSLEYIRAEKDLYPLRVEMDNGDSMLAGDFIDRVAHGEESSALLIGEGGMGKSTALLRTALSLPGSFAASGTAVVYLSLAGWKHGERNYILDRILAEMRFDANTRDMESARQALTELLSRQIRQKDGRRAMLLLLLDGLNEAVGDTAPLIEEILRLEALPGLRMVVASRSVPQSLSMRRAKMAYLEDKDVQEELERHGLLLPERKEMQKLLTTPMMLSLFVRTAREQGGQVLCQTQEELIESYLSALCAKAARNSCRPVCYQTEAAVRLVLPAIAAETTRHGALTDAQIFRRVNKCYRAVKSKLLARAFPQWVGHSREILGECANAEEWLGWMVHELLWQRLGLLVRGEDGSYRVLHQILQEYCAKKARENERSLRSQWARFSAIFCVIVALLGCGAYGGYALWFAPKPYDEELSTRILDAAIIQYVNCGKQYQSMLSMLEGEITPELCMKDVSAYGPEASQTATYALAAMQDSDADVIGWSGAPFDFENCSVLLALPRARAEEYMPYIRAYNLILSGESSTNLEEFVRSLTTLLEAEADEAWLLDRMVSLPHVSKMTDAQRRTYDQALLVLPEAQENRQVDTSKGMEYALEKVRLRQQEAVSALNTYAVMSDERAYEEE